MQVTLPLDLRPAPVTLEFDKEPDLGETAPKAQELLKASAWTWFRRAMVYSAEASKRLCGRNRKVPQDYQRAVVPDTVLFLHVFSLFCRVKCPSLSWSWQAMPHPLNEPWCLTSWVRCPLNAASSVTICLSARCILRGSVKRFTGVLHDRVHPSAISVFLAKASVQWKLNLNRGI